MNMSVSHESRRTHGYDSVSWCTSWYELNLKCGDQFWVTFQTRVIRRGILRKAELASDKISYNLRDVLRVQRLSNLLSLQLHFKQWIEIHHSWMIWIFGLRTEGLKAWLKRHRLFSQKVPLNDLTPNWAHPQKREVLFWWTWPGSN